MKTLTVTDIMAMDPCSDYTREVVEQLWSGRGVLSVLEILDLDIPARDRLWAVLREEVLGTELYRAFGHACADRVVERHALHCGIPEVERWAARWLSGEDRMAKPAMVASSIAWSATRTIARSAAWPACDTAKHAAEHAADFAVRDAAWAASAAAVSLLGVTVAAEREWQVSKLRGMVTG
jgi:hypothetical protein